MLQIDQQANQKRIFNISSLFLQSHSDSSSFLEVADETICLQLVKYLPETFSKSGSTATQIVVCAPSSAVLRNCLAIGSKTNRMNARVGRCRTISV